MLDIFTTVEGKGTYTDSKTCPIPTPEPSPPPPPSGETIISPGTAAAISVIPTPEPSPQPPYTAIIAGAVAMGGFAVVVVCAYILYQKKNLRRTNRSSTLEESAPQPPVAAEPNGGILEDDTVHWSIREAFEILDRDQRNLETRFENLRR
jgi:hypothetical protein